MLKNDKVRLVLFIAALAAAIFFFTRGIYKITNHKPGFYDIEATGDKDVPVYSEGFSLTFYLEGKSNEIKTQKNEIEECYSSTLLRAYKLTDPSNEYDGFNNLCTLNKNLGKEIQVSAELYEMLKDAYVKTLEDKGYSVFAGSYYAHWDSILVLEEPLEFDPLFNGDEKARLEALYDASSALENFSLEFKEDNVVVFNVSEEYRKLLSDNEESSSVLSLNLLRESYMLEMVKKALCERDYTRGVITTKKGLLCDLGTYDCAGYNIYSVSGDKLVPGDTVKVPAGGVMSGICALPFSEGEISYYTVEKDGKLFYRSPFAEMNKEGFTDEVLSSYVAKTGGKACDVMFINIGINSGTAGDAISADGVKIYIP